jgi:putative membrane protein
MLQTHEADFIAQAVKEAEAKTSTEIVVCIRGSSGQDRGIAALLGLVVLVLAQVVISLLLPELSFFLMLAMALAAGVAAFLLSDWFDLGLKLLPATLVMDAAREAARAAFLDRGVDHTADRNAVMLFVSRAERYVEVLPDRGLAEAIPAQRWRNIVAKFQENAGREGMVPAIAAAVAELGAICAGPFPAGADNPDLLPDRPV